MEEEINPLEEIKEGNEILAVILRSRFNDEGRFFLTSPNMPLQLGVHVLEEGVEISPHVHKPFTRLENLPSHEAFFVLEGRIRIDIFQGNHKVCSRVLEAGDVALVAAGHSLKFLEKSKLVEIKQGPYRGVENEKEFL